MITHNKPDAELVPGFWDIDTSKVPHLNLASPEKVTGISLYNERLDIDVTIVPGLLSEDNCHSLIKMFFDAKILEPVSVNGLLNDDSYGIGSVRATGWSEQIAEMLSNAIIPLLQDMSCNKFTPTDWWQNRDPNVNQLWRPVAISPMLRFMRYDQDSEHYAHYDAGFLYPGDKYRTLKSMVIYLTTNECGATRFIKDGQENIPINLRNHNDWSRRVEPGEVLYESFPVAGKVILFNHRLCHDVQQYQKQGNEQYRVIIRGDVIYERVED